LQPGFLIALVGAFISFTSTSSIIDTENRRVKFSNNLFGIIQTGKWIEIKPDMKIGLKKSHRGYRAYTRGTQPVDIHNNDIRILLYDSNKKQLMTLQKFSSYESSKSGIKELSEILGLNIVD
jgi:hypothetical protein